MVVPPPPLLSTDEKEPDGMFDSMGFEMIVLVALVVIFIAAFCGLLQKIRQSYEADRMLVSDRSCATTEDTYSNPAFIIDVDHPSDFVSVLQNAPPPYTEVYLDPPPKYEDVIKSEAILQREPANITTAAVTTTTERT